MDIFSFTLYLFALLLLWVSVSALWRCKGAKKVGKNISSGFGIYVAQNRFIAGLFGCFASMFCSIMSMLYLNWWFLIAGYVLPHVLKWIVVDLLKN